MRNTIAIAEKELKAYFASPIAYVVTAAFLAVMGYLFAVILGFGRQASLRFVFQNMSIILLLIAPALTMRLLAEEQRTGTIELLLTAPLRDVEVVLGKFLASLALLGVMLGLTLYYPLLLGLYGKPDWGPIATGYLGVLLLGAGCLAVGLFTSTLTQNQIIAAVLGMGLLLLLWVIGGAGQLVGGPVGDILRYLDIPNHFNDFTRGIVDSRDVIYYLSLSVSGLFLAVVSLQSRRWR